ncbi:MAG: DUF456 domain-containing protein [Candidatus Sericytochromatia bacterium]
MTQINGSYGAQPVYGPQQNYNVQQPQATGYNPNVNPYNRPDMYQPQQQNGLGSIFSSANNKPYVTKQSVMTGLTGAVAGFMIGGPMGAVIGGVIGLLLSVIMNVIKIKKEEGQANGMPRPQNGAIPAQMPNNYMSYDQQQMQRMQQQQMQQINQQQMQQQGQQGQQTFNPYQR